ncbi:Nonribosomal peptide synthetase sirP [Paramyrothecium foliicola]|nr:Nonribosomal peptide synthetase sirP [Paramyrothecium foliicola]
MVAPIEQATSGPRTVLDLIEQWAQKRPNHTAISFGDRKVSYAELDDAISHIAWMLSRKHVRAGDKIPVLARRGPEMVACYLGVMKAGALYVPIDTESWSDERIHSTLQRVSARVILNTTSVEYLGYEEISHRDIENAFCPTLEEVLERRKAQKLDCPWKKINPSDLAYIIFTSGTTTTPKGVMIPHSAVLNYVQQGGEETPFNFNTQPSDTVMLIFAPAFDGESTRMEAIQSANRYISACTAVIVCTLCHGAELRIATTSDFLHTVTLCTIVACTPSVLTTIQDPTTCSKLRTIILGGEAPPISLVRKWAAALEACALYNFYGPTETTFASLAGRIDPQKPITLGRPMSNSRALLLDGEQEANYGEICITGPGVGVGYYKNEALTKEKFTFWQGERMYRTGDFARRTEHGLEYAGRKDSFVKNRGFLVNLDAQVIPAINNSPTVIAATAFMYRGRLVAFVTPETVDPIALRKSLAAQHDAFYVPDMIRALDFLPLTSNGKADNRALREVLDAENSQMLETSLKVLANSGSRMDILKAAMSATMSLPISEMSETLSFLELGGNSLAGLKVLSSLRMRGLSLRLANLFDLPNLEAVCDAMEESKDATQDINGRQMITSSPTSGPMTSVQTKMVQGTLKSPSVNYMLLKIAIPHPGKTLNSNRLRAAWHHVTERHSIFRTTFSLTNEVQEIYSDFELDWANEEVDEDQLEHFIEMRSGEMRKKISLIQRGKLFMPIQALRLLTVPSLGSTLLVLMHHSQGDGWSFSVLLDELRQSLDGASLPEAPQFMEAALVQKRLRTDGQGRAFWSAMLENSLSQPQLTLPRPTVPLTPSDWTRSLKLNLGYDAKKFETLARFRGATPATVIYTAWGLVLSNYSFSDQVTFGAVFSGRNIDMNGADRVVGPLINTCPFPIEFSQERSISATLSDTQDLLLQMLEFQWSADEAMSRMPAASIANVFQTIVVMEYDLPSLSGGCETLPEQWTIEREDRMEFGISLLLEAENDGSLRARILFDGSKFAESGIASLLNHFKNALSALLDEGNVSIQDAREKLILGEERDAILNPPRERIGDYQGFNTVKDSFEAAAAQWPDLLAVESVGGSMTYRELDEAANKLAHHLMQITEPKDVVGILTDGSLYWIVSMLAAVKAGLVCCAIDVNLPAARIQLIIQQSRACVFLAANKVCAEAIDVSQENVIVADEYITSCSSHAGPLDTVATPKDAFYLVFTSGSTGVPKGVSLHHHTLLMVLDHEPTRLFSGPGRRNAQVYALGFDVVLVEVFGTICYGGTLVLKDPSDPFKHLTTVNAAHSTPSLLAACSPNDFPNLEMIGLAGEAVPQSLADAWSHKRLFNFYGPSECGPISTGIELYPGDKVTIGSAVPHLSVYLLDHHGCLVPPGITGEIYLSGEQMTQGYWNSPLQTKKSFLPNPFVPGSMMYKTGDLGYWTEDMNVAYVGRVDNQVKVRGYRIELEEIERALVRADPEITSAAAVVVDKIRIVAFVTPSTINTAAVRQNIKRILPVYARPAQVIASHNLPKSANLKIDRRALQFAAIRYKDQGDLPATDTEKMVAKIWASLLNLRPGRHISRDDDFLGVGGNSLLAIKAARLITDSIGHHVPVPLLLRETVLSSLAQAIDRHAPQVLADGLVTFKSFVANLERPADLEDIQPSSQLEEEFYHWHHSSQTKSLLNTSFQFDLEGNVDVLALKNSIVDLIHENPILRARYILNDGLVGRMISHEISPPLIIEGEICSKRLQALVNEEFDLTHDQLFRTIVWRQDDIHTSLILITHHIITDKAALSLMLQSISAKYQVKAGHSGIERDMISSKGDYIEWARWQRQTEKLPITPEMKQNKAFWKRQLKDTEPIRSLRDSQVNCELAAHQSILIPSCNGVNFSQRIAVAATALTIQAVFKNTDLVIGLPYMSRDEPGSANLLGLFLDRIPLRLSLEGDKMEGANCFINNVVSEINAAVEHRMPYSQILEAAESSGSLFDAVVIYQWASDALEKSLNLPGVQITAAPIKARGTKFPLQFEFTEQEDGLRLDLEYNARVLSPAQLDAILSFVPIAINGLAQGTEPERILAFKR